MESDLPKNEYIGNKDKLMSERLIELITDLPLTKTFDRYNMYINCHYGRFGYIRLPEFPTASNIFTGTL